MPGRPDILPAPKVYTVNETQDVPTQVEPPQSEGKHDAAAPSVGLPREPPAPDKEMTETDGPQGEEEKTQKPEETPLQKPVTILPKHVVDVIVKNTQENKLKLYVLPVSNKRADKSSIDATLYRQQIIDELKNRDAKTYKDLEGPKVLKKLRLPPQPDQEASGVLAVQIFEEKVLLTILREKGTPPQYFTFKGKASVKTVAKSKPTIAKKEKTKNAETLSKPAKAPSSSKPLTTLPAPAPPSEGSQQVQWYAAGAGGLLGISLISAGLTYVAMEDLQWLEDAEKDTSNKNAYYSTECNKVKDKTPGHPSCLSRNDFFRLNQQIREKIDEKDTEVLVMSITAGTSLLLSGLLTWLAYEEMNAQYSSDNAKAVWRPFIQVLDDTGEMGVQFGVKAGL